MISARPDPSLVGHPLHGQYRRMGLAMEQLSQASSTEASLEQLSERLGMSRWHFQRSFLRWVGVSPKQYATYLHVARAKGLLRAAHDVLDTALAVGLSGPGRLHDQFVQVEAMSPGEYKRMGQGLTIHFGAGRTPLGQAFVAWTPRGVCALGFLGPRDHSAAERELRASSPLARFASDDCAAHALLQRIFTTRATSPTAAPLRLLISGTSFQIAVWRALLMIPSGDVASYASLATWCGHPRAARAVGTAVGANPLAYLIPCHRVIRESGLLGGYRWDPQRKLAILAREIAGRAGHSGVADARPQR